MVYSLNENTHVNKLCNFKSNMHEPSCLSKKQVMVIWNWSSSELCGPWASYIPIVFYDGPNGSLFISI